MNPSSTKKKSIILPVVRLGISAGLIFFVYSRIDFPALLKTLSELKLSTALLLIALYAIGQLMSAAKWNLFLRSSDICRPFTKVIQAYFFGMFVNAFGGLGTIGGDVARSLALLPNQGKRAASLATVVADRLHGLATLLTIGALAILIVQPENLSSWVIGLSLIGVLVLIIFWKLGPLALLKIIPASHKLGPAAISAAAAFPSKKKPLIYATLISTCFHSLQIVMLYIITNALGTNISLAYLFAIVPIVNAASALPISTNGIGIRESLYTLLLTPLGLPAEAAVAIGAIWIVVVTIVSALGAIIISPKLLGKKNKEDFETNDSSEEPKLANFTEKKTATN